MRTRGHASREIRRQEEFLDSFLDYFLPDDRPSSGGGARTTSRPRGTGADRGSTGRVGESATNVLRPSACGGPAVDFQKSRSVAERAYLKDQVDEDFNTQNWDDSRDEHDTMTHRPRPKMSRKQRKPSGIMKMRSNDAGDDWDTGGTFKRTNLRGQVLAEGDEEGSAHSETSFVVRVRSRDTLVSDLTELIPGRGMHRKASGRSERALAGGLRSTSGSRTSGTRNSNASSRQKGDDISSGAKIGTTPATATSTPMTGWRGHGEKLYTFDNGIDDYDEEEICNAASRLGLDEGNANRNAGLSLTIPGDERRDHPVHHGVTREAQLVPGVVQPGTPFSGQASQMTSGKSTDLSNTFEKSSQKTSSSASTRRRGNHVSSMGKHVVTCEKNKGDASLSSGLTSADQRVHSPLIKGLFACTRGNRLERIAAQQEEMSHILVYDPTPPANQSRAFTFDSPKSLGQPIPPSSTLQSIRTPSPASIQIHEPLQSKPALLLSTHGHQKTMTNYHGGISVQKNTTYHRPNVGSTQETMTVTGTGPSLHVSTGTMPPRTTSEYDLPSPLPQAYTGGINQKTISSNVKSGSPLWPFPGHGLLTSELDQLAPLGQSPKPSQIPRRKRPNRVPRTEWRARPRSPSPPPSTSPLTQFVSDQETDYDTTSPSLERSREESTYFTGMFSSPSTRRFGTVYDRKRVASRLTFPTFHWQSDDASVGVMSLDY